MTAVCRENCICKGNISFLMYIQKLFSVRVCENEVISRSDIKEHETCLSNKCNDWIAFMVY